MLHKFLDKLLHLKADVLTSGHNSTVLHKIATIEAFEFLLNTDPNFINYVNGTSDNYNNYQSKLFQTYLSFIESKMPFSFTKRNKVHCISTIEDLYFISKHKFTIIVDNNCIKNETHELYITSGKNVSAKKYFIGKILNITDGDKNLTSKVVYHTFHVIKTRDITTGTVVSVEHYGIPPNYNMGIMSYINNVRKLLNV